MATAGVARQVRVVPSQDGEVHVPIDVASLLGADAELEVGPGMTVTLRPSKLGAPAGRRNRHDETGSRRKGHPGGA